MDYYMVDFHTFVSSKYTKTIESSILIQARYKDTVKHKARSEIRGRYKVPYFQIVIDNIQNR